MPLIIKITEVNDNAITGIWVSDNKVVHLDPLTIPFQLEIGDELYLIEHSYCDIYDKNHKIKSSLIKITDLFIKK